MFKALSGIALAIALPAAAYAHTTPAAAGRSAQMQSMSCMDHSQMARMGRMKMDHLRMSHSAMGGAGMPAMNHSKMVGMNHSRMGSCAVPAKAGSASDHKVPSN